MEKMFKNNQKIIYRKPYNKIFYLCVMFTITIFFINLVSAASWDNQQSYDKNNNESTIKNSILGIIPTSTIATAKLITPGVYRVNAGKDVKVAEFEIDLYDNEYPNAFQKMEFYDKNNKNKQIEKEFTYKYKTIELVDEVICRQGTKQLTNGSYQNICNTEKVEKEVWIALDSLRLNKLTKGKITIGIFTDVRVGDYVEWIPTLFGVRINEWAVYYGVNYQEYTSDFVNSGSWGGGYSSGIKFNVTSRNLTMFNVTTDDSATFVTIYLKNEDRTLTLATVARDASQTTTLEYNLTYGVSYWLVTSAAGNHQYGQTEGAPRNVPYNSGNVTWIKGINPTNGLEEDTTGDIKGIGVGFEQTGGGYVTLLYPANGANIITTAEINYSSMAVPNSTIAMNITNATYYVWNSTFDEINSSFVEVSGSGTAKNTSSALISGYTIGSYDWNAYYCFKNATATECKFAATNFSFTWIPVNATSSLFNTTAYEYSSESFSVNVTFSGISYNSLFASLIYNGTTYLASKSLTGNTAIFSRTLTVPTLPSDASQIEYFYWSIAVSNGVTLIINTTAENQTVSPILFTFCSDTYPSPVYVNFTTYSEDTREKINVTFNGAFNYRLVGSTQVKNYSYNPANQNSSFKFCTNANRTFIVDSAIKLSNDDYTERTYYFNDESYTNNSVTEQRLYLLNSSIGSNIIIEVTDPGLQPLASYYVNIKRYYPEINGYLPVISERTDEYGQFVARLIQNTEKYIFIFKNPSGTVVKTTTDITIACRTTICILSFVIEDTINDFEKYDNVTDFDYSLTFNDVTNNFSYSWNDATGDLITSRLFVQRLLFNGTTTVCNVSSTSSINVLNCYVGSQTAGYRAQSYRRAVGESERRIAVLNVQVGGSSGIFGLEGLLWSFILLFTLVGVGAYNPTAGVLLYMVGFFGLGAMGIIQFSPLIFIATLILGVVFIWAFRR